MRTTVPMPLYPTKKKKLLPAPSKSRSTIHNTFIDPAGQWIVEVESLHCCENSSQPSKVNGIVSLVSEGERNMTHRDDTQRIHKRNFPHSGNCSFSRQHPPEKSEAQDQKSKTDDFNLRINRLQSESQFRTTRTTWRTSNPLEAPLPLEAGLLSATRR